MLAQVQLLDRSADFARMYSGGMKRRLSVALSTVGDVQVIFFDGMCVCFFLNLFCLFGIC
jgi:ABC-type multidrug transport system ATPase subunit